MNRTRQDGIEQENMKIDIKTKVDEAHINQKTGDEVFYLFHTNIFCITAEGRGV